MVKFKLDGIEVDMPNWAKHHKEIGLRVKREKSDGEIVLVKNEEVQSLVSKYENSLRQKGVSFYNQEARSLEHGIDFFLPIPNVDYEEANIDYYSVGATNTEQTTHVRLTFMLDYDKAVLDYSFNSQGSFASSLSDIISSSSSIEDIIEEILDRGLALEEVGISRDEEYGGYVVMLVTPEGDYIDAQVEKNELIKSLVGVEVYRFEQEIN